MHKNSVKVKVWFMFYLEYSFQIFLILYFRMKSYYFRMKSYNEKSVRFHVRGLWS